MSEPELRLIIAGPLGSGKTTLAQFIVRCLRSYGVRVTLRDPYEHVTDEMFQLLIDRMRERSADGPVAVVSTHTYRVSRGAQIRVLDWVDQENGEAGKHVEVMIAGSGVLLTAAEARRHAERLVSAAEELEQLQRGEP